MKTDAEIKRDVLHELEWDPRIDETDVGVEVDLGVVTLTGTVDSYSKRVAAQEAAHRVSGVLDVANDIAVKLPGSRTRTDTEIARAVRDELEWNTLLPSDDIQSTVANGWVILEGTVGSYHERVEATRAVQNLPGVHGVVNRITVAASSVTPEQVRHEIERALERRAERAARHIRVTVHDGKVTLAGPVQSWAEREAVLGAALYTPGVQEIEDRLYVQSATYRGEYVDLRK